MGNQKGDGEIKKSMRELRDPETALPLGLHPFL
jgi:hypothetical protein